MFTRLLAFGYIIAHSSQYIQHTGLAIGKRSSIENSVGASPIDHLIPQKFNGGTITSLIFSANESATNYVIGLTRFNLF